MERSRDTLRSVIEEEMRVDAESEDGWRPVLHGDTEVGLLREAEPSLWHLSVKLEGWDRWRPNPSKLEQPSAEVAEAWAIHEVADFMAMREQAEQRDA